MGNKAWCGLGLRELVKKHGKGAGRVMNKTLQENDTNNAATLEDLAVRICVIFVLDRFGDYVSDTVVARFVSLQLRR